LSSARSSERGHHNLPRPLAEYRRLYRALPDVASTPDLLGPLLNHADSFVIIQNGVGVEEELRRRLPAAMIISCRTWVGAAIVENGSWLTQYGVVGIPFSTAFFLVNRVAGTHCPGRLSSSSRGKPRGRVSEPFDRSPPQRGRAAGARIRYCGPTLEKSHMVGSRIAIEV